MTTLNTTRKLVTMDELMPDGKPINEAVERVRKSLDALGMSLEELEAERIIKANKPMFDDVLRGSVAISAVAGEIEKKDASGERLTFEEFCIADKPNRDKRAQQWLEWKRRHPNASPYHFSE